MTSQVAVKPAHAHVDGAVQPDLHQLAFGEVPAEVVVDRVVDGQVVRGEQVGEPQRGALGVGEVVGLGGAFERADERLGDPVLYRLVVADRHAAAALVVERDAEPDELDESPRQRPLVVDGVGDRAQRGRDLGAMGDDATDAELHPLGLVEGTRIDARYLDRCDACHPTTSPGNRGDCDGDTGAGPVGRANVAPRPSPFLCLSLPSLGSSTGPAPPML